MKNHTAMPSKYCPHGRQRGFSLIEMMIALTIGILLLIGLSSLFLQQSASRSELEKSSRQIENGRYAMQILQDNIEHAGFYGEYTPPSGATVVPTDPCDATVTGWATPSTVPVPIFGYPGGGADPTIGVSSPAGCLPNYKANTAVLVVRRTATPFITGAPLANTLYMQTSRCGNDVSRFVVGTAGFILRQGDCATPARLRQYLVNIYYISQCSTPTAGGACAATDDNGKWIPTLMLVQNGAAPTPLVEGIENMQFDYGVDTTSDGSPDIYPNPPALTTANWPNVMTVRVSLLARNIETTPNYADAKSYSLGSVTIAADGNNHKRHVYTELVRAINPIGWRS